MKNKCLVFSLFLAFGISFSEEITSEQLSSDASACNEELTKIASQIDHLSFLVDLLQYYSKNVNTNSLTTNHKGIEDSCLNRMETLVEHGILIQKKVNNLDGKTCSPCLKSTVGRFCKNVLTLKDDIKRSVSEIEKSLLSEPVAFSEELVSYLKLNAEKTVSTSKMQNFQIELEKAQKLSSQDHYKEAMTLIINIIRTIYNGVGGK